MTVKPCCVEEEKAHGLWTEQEQGDGVKDTDRSSANMPRERLGTWTISAFHSHYLTLTVIRFTAPWWIHAHTHRKACSHSCINTHCAKKEIAPDKHRSRPNTYAQLIYQKRGVQWSVKADFHLLVETACYILCLLSSLNSTLLVLFLRGGRVINNWYHSNKAISFHYICSFSPSSLSPPRSLRLNSVSRPFCDRWTCLKRAVMQSS